MRKAPEPFDDLEIGASVTTQRTAAIGIPWQGIEKCQRAPLVGDVLAVMKRHIEEQPPGGWDQLVEAAFERSVGGGVRRRVGRVSARGAAKDIARHLVEQQ